MDNYASSPTSNLVIMPAAKPSRSPWFAVRVRPNFEKTVVSGLAARGYEQFCPSYKETRKWSDRIKVTEFPLFPGYIFCRLDPEFRSPVLYTPGVIGILSCGPNLLPLSEEEIEAVRRVARGDYPVEPSPYLVSGTRARVVRGALTGIEGLILEERSRCRLVLQISLLQRAVSVQIERDCLEPIRSA